MNENKKKFFRVYRANNNLNGSATSWELSYKEDQQYDKWVMFLVAAKQIEDDKNGNARFDWDNAVTVKLGEPDIAEIMAVLERRKPSVGMKGGLFHNSPSGGNKVVSFSSADNGAYYLKVSAQDKDKNEIGKIQQVIGAGDASILLTLFKRAIERFYDW